MQEFWWPPGPPTTHLARFQPHEKAWLRRWRLQSRRELNFRLLSQEGLDELVEMLESGHYRIRSPEEGALLAVAWLASRGRLDAMETVLDRIGPSFPFLRFYPEPHPEPYHQGERLWLKPLGVVRRRLTAVALAPERATEENIRVWTPFFHEVLEFLRSPDGTEGEANRLWQQLMALSSEHFHFRRHWARTGELARLRSLLRRRCEGPLSEQDREWLGRRRPLRAPTSVRRGSLARELSQKMAGGPRRGPWEGQGDWPPSLQRIADLARPGGLEELIERKVVSCGRTLAQIVPQLAAPECDHPALVRLVQAMQAVFPPQTDYHFGEIPWVGPLLSARAVLERVLRLHLETWPDLPLAPSLVAQLIRLCDWGSLDLPWPWPDNLPLARQLLEGTLYQRYFQVTSKSPLALQTCDQLAPALAYLRLQLPLEKMARTAYERICRRPRRCWRQLVLYLSLMSGEPRREFLDWAHPSDEETRELLLELRRLL